MGTPGVSELDSKIPPAVPRFLNCIYCEVPPVFSVYRLKCFMTVSREARVSSTYKSGKANSFPGVLPERWCFQDGGKGNRIRTGNVRFYRKSRLSLTFKAECQRGEGMHIFPQQAVGVDGMKALKMQVMKWFSDCGLFELVLKERHRGRDSLSLLPFLSPAVWDSHRDYWCVRRLLCIELEMKDIVSFTYSFMLWISGNLFLVCLL